MLITFSNLGKPLKKCAQCSLKTLYLCSTEGGMNVWIDLVIGWKEINE